MQLVELAAKPATLVFVSANLFSAEDVDMPNPILGAATVSDDFYQRIGRIAVEWSWVEHLCSDLLAHFCSADPGAMYVITQNVSNSTVTDWLRTIGHIKLSQPDASEALKELLLEVDAARTERNTIVHGTWLGHTEDGFAIVNTFKWERAEVSKDELYSIADLDDLIDQMEGLQLALANFGIQMGFFKGQ